MMAQSAFRLGLCSIALYAKATLTTKKSSMIKAYHRACPIIIGKAMMPSIKMTFPKKPTKGELDFWG